MKQQIIQSISAVCIALLFASSVGVAQTVQVLDQPMKTIECVTEAQYQQSLKPILKKNIADLRQAGKLPAASEAKMTGEVKLAWPLKMTDDYASIDGVYDGWVVYNYIDLNHADNAMKDWWNCVSWTASNYGFQRAQTYDGHNGADIVPYPFFWQMMDDESIDVVAAADGEVIYKYSGNTIDRNCDTPHVFNFFEFNSGYYGNFIALLHSDNSITIYGHMKYGTLADVEVGDEVVQGQFLGKIGSSGNSSAPHLHFEYRKCEDCSYTEPWFKEDGCNDDITESQWISQRPFKDTRVLRVATHNALPVFKECVDYEGGSNETVNFSNHFSTSDVLMISVAMEDFIEDEEIDVDIISSSGLLKESMNFTVDPGVYYEHEIIFFTTTLTDYATGTYKIKVTYDGNYYYHFFTVNCPPALTLSGAHTGVKGFISGDNITSTATISGVSTNNTLYQAETYVKLNVGFQASANCKFRGQIDDCTLGGLKVEEPVAEIQDRQILISPNPNFGIFNLQYTTAELAAMYFVIRNALGEIIYTSAQYAGGNVISETVNMGSVSKGLYFVEVHEGENIVIEKLVIQ